MNHKVLFLVLLLVIVVGLSGLIVGNNNSKIPEQAAVTERSILIAQAEATLPAGYILTHGDYSFRNITVPLSSHLIKYDISGVSSLKGYLLKDKIVKDSYLSPKMIASPNSASFIQQSLRTGEVAYKFYIKKTSEYLLDSLVIGDAISVYLRTLEVNKDENSKANISLESESGKMSGKKNQQYVLHRIISHITILNIEKYTKDKSKDRDYNSNKFENDVGHITVRINTPDLESVRTVEKTGDILLFPTGSENSEVYLDNILPKLHSIRELRG